MPSITLANLDWSTPDGRSLFSDLNLSFTAERAGLVGRNGVGKTTLLRLIAGTLPIQSGSVHVNGRIAVLGQDIQYLSGETVADVFGATAGLALLRRAEDGAAAVEELAEADWSLPERIAAALARAGLEAEPETPLARLSGGQRTRAGLAAAIFGAPDFLLLDEPTNNLDRDGREAVRTLLAGWRGGAIVVSHDRRLLDTMDAIVEMTSLGVVRYGGNWTEYRAHKEVELEAAHRTLAEAKRSATLADRNAQTLSERKARKDSAGRRKGAKGDMPRILIGARKNRAEGTGGNNARLAERQRFEASQAVRAARENIEILEGLAVALPATGLPAKKVVLEINSVTVGYQPDRPILQNFSLSIRGPERIAVTGRNGSGKTTLVALIAGTLPPWSGTVRTGTSLAVLDQRATLLDPSHSIRDNFIRINPESDENACRAALARFTFRADAALQQVSTLSGGQMLRAALACVLGGSNPPQLLILDEPTNHLDLDSILAMEAGLRAYDGALLVVSHDESFVQAIGTERSIELGNGLTNAADRSA